MTSPADRNTRFNLRLSPDEKAACEDLQDRMGGPDDVSMNTVIATLIVEGYYYRTTSDDMPTVPLTSESWNFVQDTANELGITTADAVALLIYRGAPHQPQKDCLNPKPGFRQVVRIPNTLPVHPQGRIEDPNGPRYAAPRPSGLPPVPTVPGQDSIDIEGDTPK